MVRHVIAAVCLIALTASTAQAQVKFVVSAFGGYSWAEGVKGKDIVAGDGNIYNQADPTSSPTFGFSFGVAEHHGEYGFIYRRQMGQFQVSGTTTTTVGDLNTDTYHGYYTYYFGDPEGKVQFYLSAGAGMTHYSTVNFTTAAGQAAAIAGRSEFSPTFGAGVRTMFNEMVGLRFGLQWTPTYLTIDQGHIYCDPYYGCFLQTAQYANQVDVSAGITFRFGKK